MKFHKENCKENKVRQSYFEEIGTEQKYDSLCGECQDDILSLDESLIFIMNGFSDQYFSEDLRDLAYFDHFEKMDLHKAEILEKQKKTELPIYLKKYMDRELSLKDEKAEISAIVRLGKKGITLLSHTVSEFLNPKISFSLQPAMRAETDLLTPAVMKIQDTSEENFTEYQVYKENDNSVYLSVKFEPGKEGFDFDQVNLKKGSRFILSSRMNESGTVNFSGLEEGEYRIELKGKGKMKIFDLCVIHEESNQ